MTEQKRLIFAKAYIDAMRNGVNPVDLQPIPETDVLNDEHIQNCLAYVSEILGAVIENGGTDEKDDIPKRSHSRKLNYFITSEQISQLKINESLTYVSDISKELNKFSKVNGCKQLQAKHINQWLVSIEMLESVETAPERICKKSTEQGEKIGIHSKYALDGKNIPYYRTFFSKEAQQFIYDNIDAIIEYNRNL
ncbi:MAG: hypothetical protein V3G42_03845 [Oscillospiraceae bacterium]